MAGRQGLGRDRAAAAIDRDINHGGDSEHILA
jgi:hypothetical protein